MFLFLSFAFSLFKNDFLNQIHSCESKHLQGKLVSVFPTDSIVLWFGLMVVVQVVVQDFGRWLIGTKF